MLHLCRYFFVILTDCPMPVELDIPEIRRDPSIDKCDITMKWKEPCDNGASITRYRVYQRILGGTHIQQQWRNIYSSNCSDFQYHVFNLQRGKEYEFKVTAENKIGEGRDDETHYKRVKVREGKHVNDFGYINYLRNKKKYIFRVLIELRFINEKLLREDEP